MLFRNHSPELATTKEISPAFELRQLRISIWITLDSPSRFFEASPRLKRSRNRPPINIAPISLRLFSFYTHFSYLARSSLPRDAISKRVMPLGTHSIHAIVHLRPLYTQRRSINAFAEQLWKIDS